MKINELSDQYDKDVGTTQIRPKNMQEFSNCIDIVAQSRKKGLTALFESIEQEVLAKQTFIVSQQEQLVNMQNEYEFLVEQRSVVEKAQHVIFGKKEKKSNLEEFFSGETD